MFTPFRFEPTEMPASTKALREHVREFLKEREGRWTCWLRGHSWTGVDREFSREVGQQGWIGMTWPKVYGGGERSMLDRYVVLEEMLAVGAPVGAHWIADRQSGPLLLRVGTEEQRQRYLPGIVRGELAFCIGLSEPDAGSDLAAIRTRADKVPGGWKINGRKIWTTNAHISDYMIALVRTAGTPKDRQAGLSQFLVDLKSHGVEVRAINDLTTEAHFNEVTFDDLFVSDDALVGGEGHGWDQANAELAFERSGPDRYMSVFPLMPMLIDTLRAGGGGDRLDARKIGQAAAELAVLRQMSVSIAGMLAAGETPNQEASVVKELGVALEQRMPDLVRELTSSRPACPALAEMLSAAMQLAPTFSLRGGTREIIRGIIARGLGLR
jgi:alkylation response protein AidB-like acyl-CoA dehydrogenase